MFFPAGSWSVSVLQLRPIPKIVQSCRNSWDLRAFSACRHLTLFLPIVVEKLFGFQGAVKGSKIPALLLVSYSVCLSDLGYGSKWPARGQEKEGSTVAAQLQIEFLWSSELAWSKGCHISFSFVFLLCGSCGAGGARAVAGTIRHVTLTNYQSW